MLGIGLGLLLSAPRLAAADPMVGDKWVAFDLPDNQEQIQSWKPGQVTVISFCAMWCSTWKAQVPILAESKKELEGLPVQFITVSVDGRWTGVDKDNSGLPLWTDPGGEWSHGLGVNRVPTTVVLDASGTVRFVRGGVTQADKLDAAVQSALKDDSPDKVIYLTFDDFPERAGDRRLLDVLFANSVPATIFCIGDHMGPNVDLLKTAIADGDRLECHSWSHDASVPDLEKCWQEFYDELGIEPTLYRPPGSEVVLGDSLPRPIVDPYDYQRPSADELMRRVLSAASDGAVVQLHAGVEVTLEVLPKIIANLRSRGFHFALLGDPNPTTRTHPPADWSRLTPPGRHPVLDNSS